MLCEPGPVWATFGRSRVIITKSWAAAVTEIQWWHAFTGPLGEILAKQVEDFNSAQSDYKVVAVYKGSYPETMTAGIAAFRAGKAPAILQVFEVGTATMMAAKGAVNPVFEVMKAGGEAFDPAVYLPTVTGYYTDPEGNMLSMPYNSSNSVQVLGGALGSRPAFLKASLL